MRTAIVVTDRNDLTAMGKIIPFAEENQRSYVSFKHANQTVMNAFHCISIIVMVH